MTVTTTEHGLEIDRSFAAPADDDTVAATAAALRERGHTVVVVDDLAAARDAVLAAIPDGRSVFTMASETLKAAGLDGHINGSGRYDAVRPRIYAMDLATQAEDIRRLGAAADVVIGSVHAVTADGTLVTTSGSGSQLALYAFGAGVVIHVVGAQKLVPDLDTAWRRMRTYSWPLEDVRARVAYGRPGEMRKTLVTESEAKPGRSTVVLVREAVGF
jgi:hypothetical protein